MIENFHPLLQALLGSLFTWGMTAMGAGCVIFISPRNKQLLDASLGFAAGVMTAASFWSLLSPAIEITELQFKHWGFIPVSVGFLVGAAFVYLTDKVLPCLGFTETKIVSMLNRRLAKIETRPRASTEEGQTVNLQTANGGVESGGAVGSPSGQTEELEIPTVVSVCEPVDLNSNHVPVTYTEEEQREMAIGWRRIFLLVVAITVHNFPEGLAVGVGFGAIGKSPSATFESACTLALGIGIQNFPEGLAVSLPLAGFGYTKARSFWYGQLSGMVEPVAAVLGAAAVSFMKPLLPYALSFAAGAMIYVVIDDIILEAQSHGNGKLASWGGILGFVVMMSLDVALG